MRSLCEFGCGRLMAPELVEPDAAAGGLGLLTRKILLS